MMLGQVMTPLEGALHIASRGLPVAPCRYGEKTPTRKAWKQRATRNPEDIGIIFGGKPCNVAVPTEGLIVLDDDTRKKGLPEWHLIDALPPTLTVETPSGGRHYYFRRPDGVTVSNSAGALAPGYDIRTDGGHVIGPGSVFDGKPYRIIDASPIADVPLCLLSLCQSYRAPKSEIRQVGELDTPSAIDSATSYLKHSAPEAIEHSGGNAATYKVACQVRDRGISPETALELMLEHYNETKCFPAWEPGELQEIVDHAYAYGQNAAGRDNPAAGFCVIELSKPHDDVESLLERASDVTREQILAASARDILKGMIAPGMSGTIYGDSGVGKSHIALDLSFHVAHGLEYHGLKTRKVPVLYVQLEGVAGFRKRILATAEKFGDPGDYFTRLKMQVSLAKDDNGQKGADTIVKAVRHLKRATSSDSCLVIVDTKARATAGDQENDGADMSAFAEKRQGYIARETDACVLVVHHTNKSGDYRGHGSQKAGDDLVLKVERGKVTAEKVKDGEEGPFFGFKLDKVHLGTDSDGCAVTTCVVTKSATVADEPKADRATVRRKEAVTFMAAFQKVARERTHPETGEVIDAATAGAIRQEFFAAYPSGEADLKKAQANKRKAWARAIRELLPPGYKIRTFEDVEIIWRERSEW